MFNFCSQIKVSIDKLTMILKLRAIERLEEIGKVKRTAPEFEVFPCQIRHGRKNKPKSKKRKKINTKN